MDTKRIKLEAVLASYPNLLVAFSGGVDSTLLLAVARDVLKDRVEAVTSVSPVHSRREAEAARALAARLGVVHHLIHTEEMSLPAFLANSGNRCYICKTHLFSRFRALAVERRIDVVAHGANVDDLRDYRPGFRAAEEAGVAAPLLAAGLDKDEIRTLAHKRNLPNWDRPADACLATRVPYGVSLSAKMLRRIDRAEALLAKSGVDRCRVRVHANVARIEVPEAQFERLIAPAFRRSLVAALRQLGFDHVALDLEGYRMGSMNRALEKDRK